MTSGRRSDRGQAFPIYIVVIAGLLFAALAFFVVGRAAITRSDAQGAADAAALAAGREARDAVLLNLDLAALKPADWERIVEGGLFKGGGACAAADAFAAKNNGKLTLCDPTPPRFTVSVETDAAVGDSVIPETGNLHGTATATALVQAKCSLRAAPAPSPTLTAPAEGSSPAPTPSPSTVDFTCGGELVKLDPLKPGSLSALTRRLFSVRLVG
ncbi:MULTISPECIES: pilus assembly protein TadG-related protein [unclassified Streptomyces]|uniref:pilus assembly protein TadG-related protein n=1 Tax=unclassified Streptomyces TaxID=2593676 RepID=UPI002E1142BE|nr:pilus assembly protein TadG-related protein [Streptomyces sp. NBC_01207]WTA18882.1 pilus assembly protein TadG-related protein [Streptomyces sp. NBC_00853]